MTTSTSLADQAHPDYNDPKKSNELDDIKVVSTPWFKLKDKQGRTFQGINLKKQFGFIPEIIIVEKKLRDNNVISVKAILTKAELKKRAKELAVTVQENVEKADKSTTNTK